MEDIIKACLLLPVIAIFIYTNWKYNLQRNRCNKNTHGINEMR